MFTLSNACAYHKFSIAIQVLRSLAFMHTLGLIHSDLKPENILIKSYSRCEVKVRAAAQATSEYCASTFVHQLISCLLFSSSSEKLFKIHINTPHHENSPPPCTSIFCPTKNSRK